MQRLAGALTGCILLGGCTHAPWHPNQGWAASQSEHVTVFTDALVEHQFSQEWLELSHSAYRAFLPGVKRERVDVVWLKSEPGWASRVFSPTENPQSAWTLESLPGGGPIGRDGLIVLETRDANAAATQLAHLFIESAVPKAALWLHVGLAHYMAKARIHRTSKNWKACFGSPVFDEPATSSVANEPQNFFRPTARVSVRGSGREVTIPLERVLKDDWYGYDTDGRYWFEYTAYAFVHFLIHGKNGWHQTRFPILLEALRDGKPTDEALGLAYPHLLPDEWDDALADYVRPQPGAARRAGMRELAQGICLDIPPRNRPSEGKPVRVAVDEKSIRNVMDELRRIDLFRRHANWLPQDIVAVEGATRDALTPGGRGSGGKPGTGKGAGESSPDPTIPTVRSAPTVP